MNLVRHQLGDSEDGEPIPNQRYLPCDLLSGRSMPRLPLNKVLAIIFRGAPLGKHELSELFENYVEAKQAQNVLDYDDLLLYWAGTITNADDDAGRRRPPDALVHRQSRQRHHDVGEDAAAHAGEAGEAPMPRPATVRKRPPGGRSTSGLKRCGKANRTAKTKHRKPNIAANSRPST